jgi:hypothetical protein
MVILCSPWTWISAAVETIKITTASATHAWYRWRMETSQLVALPDGTYALIERSVTWGDATIILLLAMIVLIELYTLWHRK